MTKAIILAAGSSTRTFPLTLTKPKPLLRVANISLLEHNLNSLNGIVSEVIIVVGYKKEMIIKKFKNKFKNLKLSFVTQKDRLGTGNALLTAEPFIKNHDFIVMMGDDLYSKTDVKNILKEKFSVLSQEVKDPSLFGVFVVHNNKVRDLIEKPQLFTSRFVNCALYHFDKKIFSILKNLKKSSRHEYELTDGLRKLAQNEDVFIVKAHQWLPIGYPWDLLVAYKKLRKGNIIGSNSSIKGSVKNSSIGDNCVIDGIVKDSIVMDNVLIKKDSIIESSIIGDKVHFSGTIKALKNSTSLIKKIPIPVKNFGAVIADGVIADNVTIASGVKIWPHLKISGNISGDVVE